MIRTNYVQLKKRAVRWERILKGVRAFKSWYLDRHWFVVCNLVIAIIHALVSSLTPYVFASTIFVFVLLAVQPLILVFLPIFEAFADERWDQALNDIENNPEDSCN